MRLNVLHADMSVCTCLHVRHVCMYDMSACTTCLHVRHVCMHDMSYMSMLLYIMYKSIR